MSTGDAPVLFGLDVSARGVNWAAAKAGGCTFMFHRLTTAADTVDPDALADIAAARAAGVIPGAYAFLHANALGTSEARQFIAALGDPAGMLVALDIEQSGITTQAVLNWFGEWFAAHPNHPVILYGSTYLRTISYDLAKTPPPYWLPTWPYRSGTVMPLPLDVAYAKAYAAKPTVWETPYSAILPTIWQFAGNAPAFGGLTDFDAFNGTLDELLALTGENDMDLSKLAATVGAPCTAGSTIYDQLYDGHNSPKPLGISVAGVVPVRAIANRFLTAGQTQALMVGGLWPVAGGSVLGWGGADHVASPIAYSGADLEAAKRQAATAALAAQPPIRVIVPVEFDVNPATGATSATIVNP